MERHISDLSGPRRERRGPRLTRLRGLLLPGLCLAGLAGPAAADWTVFVGPPGGVGSLWTIPESGVGGAPVAGLEQIELLAIDHVGRTRLERFLPNRPRHELLAGGASRLVLPAAQGSLYAYRRDEPGASHFGLFRVCADGTTIALWEAPGTGVAQADSPLLPFVSVVSSGDHVLLATTVAAGGDLLEVDLVTGTLEDRTAEEPPLAFLPKSLGLCPTFGVAMTDTGPWRFARTAGARALPVGFAGSAPAFFADGVVFSGDELRAGMLAGEGPQALRVLTLGPSGLAVFADMSPSHIEGPGFLPDQLDGPYFALSIDGSRVGYRAALPKVMEPGLTREAFVTEVATGAQSFQLTADALMIDTIDEIGILRFQPTGELLYAAGERNDGPLGGLDKIDVYSSGLDPAGGTIQNVTLSSGFASPPFLGPGVLSPEDGMFLQPGADRLVLHDGQSGGTGELLSVDLTSSGVTSLLPAVKSLDGITWSGSAFVASVRRDLPGDPRQLLVLPGAGGAQVLASAPELTTFDSLAPGPGGAVGLIVALGTSEWIARVDTVAGTGKLLSPIPFAYSQHLGFTPTGELRFSLEPLAGVHLGWNGASISGIALGPPTQSALLPGL